MFIQTGIYSTYLLIISSKKVDEFFSVSVEIFPFYKNWLFTYLIHESRNTSLALWTFSFGRKKNLVFDRPGPMWFTSKTPTFEMIFSQISKSKPLFKKSWDDLWKSKLKLYSHHIPHKRNAKTRLNLNFNFTDCKQAQPRKLLSFSTLLFNWILSKLRRV